MDAWDGDLTQKGITVAQCSADCVGRGSLDLDTFYCIEVYNGARYRFLVEWQKSQK